MKKISNALKLHLKNSVTTLANCWLITFKDGSNLGFTDYKDDIIYDNIQYHHNVAISTSSVESSNSLSADNFEIEAVLDSSLILQDDLISGKYNKAYIEYFIINYLDLSQGSLLIKAGHMHNLRLINNRFLAEVRSIAHELNKQTRSIYSEDCRAKFKDKQCKATDVDYIICGSITKVNGNILEVDLSIKHPGLYRNSKIEVIDKISQKKVYLVKEVSDKNIILQQISLVSLKKGAKFLLFPQCDKRFSTCCDIFNNSLNFRGEPHVPGVDEINKTAGTFK